MGIFELFSQRVKKGKKAGQPDVYQLKITTGFWYQ